jgi:hypothetical protein
VRHISQFLTAGRRPIGSRWTLVAAIAAIAAAIATVPAPRQAHAETCVELHQCLVSCSEGVLYGASNEELDTCTDACIGAAGQCEEGVVPQSSDMPSARACSAMHQCFVVCAEGVLHGATDDDLVTCQSQCTEAGSECEVATVVSNEPVTCWYNEAFGFSSVDDGNRTGHADVGQAVQFGNPGPYMWALVLESEPCPELLLEHLIVATPEPPSTQTGPATQAYLDYREAVVLITEPADALAYIASSSEAHTEPAETQAMMLEFMQVFITETENFAVLSETTDGSRATIVAEAFESDGTKYQITITMVLEGTEWKIEKEDWVGESPQATDPYSVCVDACYTTAETGEAQCQADNQSGSETERAAAIDLCTIELYRMADDCIIQCQADYPE